jgi:NTP pyrophosphatase (non-canonical NTP hydrolase)
MEFDLNEIFDTQSKLQAHLGLGAGTENVIQWYNAMTAAILEIGEALAEDTRWKALLNGNNKKAVVNRNNVVEETADVFIYLLNACIFYNISIDELLTAIVEKQQRNIRRLTKCSKK